MSKCVHGADVWWAWARGKMCGRQDRFAKISHSKRDCIADADDGIGGGGGRSVSITSI